MLALAWCAKATPANDAPGWRHSRMIASFSPIEWRRRGRRRAGTDPPSCACTSLAMVSACFVADAMFARHEHSIQDGDDRTLTDGLQVRMRVRRRKRMSL